MRLKKNDLKAVLAYSTILQHGKLRHYLIAMLTATLGLLVVFGGFPPPMDLAALTGPALTFEGDLALLRIVAFFIIVGTSLACVLLANDIFGILAVGGAGLGVAVLMALEPAPDAALVQIVVDILVVIILVLALTRLPARKLRKAQQLVLNRRKTGLLRDALVSIAFGIVVMLMSLAALLSRPRISGLFRCSRWCLFIWPCRPVFSFRILSRESSSPSGSWAWSGFRAVPHHGGACPWPSWRWPYLSGCSCIK